jgi:tetratricopeptide (TPR) repeat protein
MYSMSEETSNPRMSTSADSSDSELSLLRKEVIESRNLVIKTDNLLKNLHAELKLMGRKHDEQERRHWMTSVTAYVAFALIASAGAIAYARAEVRTAREEAAANESRAKTLHDEAEKIKSASQLRHDTSEKAMHVYELLGTEKEGPGLTAAMQQSLHLDRSQLSALESKAIDDRAAGMKVRIAEAALSAGQAAFRRSDWKAASEELGHYVEMEPKVSDPIVYFHLGNARMQLHDYANAIAPLDSFLKNTGGTKTAQYAGFLLGQAYEETGNAAGARSAYERAASLYPGSDIAPGIRARLRRLSSSPTTGTAPAAATTTAPPPAANPTR